MKIKRYSDSDYEFICKHYGYLTAVEIAKELDRTKDAIDNTVKRLKENGKFEFYRNRNFHWTELKINDSKPRSGVRGILWREDIKKWLVTPSRNKKTYYLGCYGTLEEAKDVLEEFKETYEEDDWA